MIDGKSTVTILKNTDKKPTFNEKQIIKLLTNEGSDYSIDSNDELFAEEIRLNKDSLTPNSNLKNTDNEKKISFSNLSYTALNSNFFCMMFRADKCPQFTFI